MTNDYPRMMFHRTLDPVTVHSRDEEELLGVGWSRTIGGSPPREERPVKPPDPEPDEEPDEEEPEELPAEPEPEKRRPAPPAQGQANPKANRGRPLAHKPVPHKRKA